MGAGYSKRSLADKLGIKAGYRLRLVNPPQGYLALLAPLPDGISWVDGESTDLDLIQFFVMSRAQASAGFQTLPRQITQSGSLWVSWPKRASKIVTDLDDNVIREIGLTSGLVDVKVAAIDETWSALKFVYRLKDRK